MNFPSGVLDFYIPLCDETAYTFCRHSQNLEGDFDL